ncbi:uncharacterized protein JN550_010026 [Neoarthrinium moseri]|uniref:uncharacterized protein n=1 Tax=Neoarthrinium moseri TaxID=1658444 RepID=UPI001FDCE8AF|nr:uncharacterized protein JN550_010026 [Neoarthrinium moseri]KAI1862689.1 hypothetical protein JN550_010026 [Neoarthrinium moseri]
MPSSFLKGKPTNRPSSSREATPMTTPGPSTRAPDTTRNSPVLSAAVTEGNGNATSNIEGASKDRPNYINLKFKESARYQRETMVRVERTAAIGGTLEEYARQVGKHLDVLRFITYDGQRIGSDDSPADLELEEGDIVDVLIPQHGGMGEPSGLTSQW